MHNNNTDTEENATSVISITDFDQMSAEEARQSLDYLKEQTGVTRSLPEV